MTSLAVLLLARHTGPGFEPLAHDIAAIVRPGDHVVVVADDASRDTAFRTGRFIEQTGFGPDVAVTRLLTGSPGEGDTGVAINLGLQALALPGAARARLLVAGPGSRISAPDFAAARAHAEAEDLDLLAFALRQWCADPGQLCDGPDPAAAATPGADPRALTPGLDGMLLRWSLAAGLRCSEGGGSHGALPAWWQAVSGALSGGRSGAGSAAGRWQIWPHPLGHRGQTPDPDASLLTALTGLLARHPDAATWVQAALPRLLAGLGPGGVAGVIAAGPALADSLAKAQEQTQARNTGLSSGPSFGPNPAFADQGHSTALLQAFGRGDTARARQLLRGVRGAQKETVAPKQSRIAAPAPLSGAPLVVHLAGPHRQRTPLAYRHLAPLWDGAIELTATATHSDLAHTDLARTDMTRADLIVIAHPRDVAAVAGAPARTPLALISEEPFWDTLFSPDPLARRITLGARALHQINHHRSAIFDFDRIPYYILTEPGFIDRYAALFARNAALSAQDWQQALAARPLDLAFMAERRPEAFHNISLPRGDILGLCAWRTELALACNHGRVARLGASWGSGPSRFALDDWHADKLAQLDGQTRMLSGIENTHQPCYLSEKLFDAFACGAQPLYLASPGHRVHDLGLPPGAWLNLWGSTPAQAAERIEAARITPRVAADYAGAQRQLAALFTDPGAVAAERARLGRALLAEVRRLADLGPA